MPAPSACDFPSPAAPVPGARNERLDFHLEISGLVQAESPSVTRKRAFLNHAQSCFVYLPDLLTRPDSSSLDRFARRSWGRPGHDLLRGVGRFRYLVGQSCLLPVVTAHGVCLLHWLMVSGEVFQA